MMSSADLLTAARRVIEAAESVERATAVLDAANQHLADVRFMWDSMYQRLVLGTVEPPHVHRPHQPSAPHRGEAPKNVAAPKRRGRPSVVRHRLDEMNRMFREGMTVAQVAKAFGVHRNSVYKAYGDTTQEIEALRAAAMPPQKNWP